MKTIKLDIEMTGTTHLTRRFSGAGAFLSALAALLCANTAEARTSHLEVLYPNTFNPTDVTMKPSRFTRAMDTNIRTLKQYDIDRLVAPYLTEAGLEARKPAFENWAGLDGHVGGHYLTALAIHYADTGDPELLERMNYMLAEMKRAQDANGDGYVGGVPQSKEVWAALRAGNIQPVLARWVPWYNMHKVYAGLRDAYIYADSEEALEMFRALCDWGVDVIANLDDATMERMLDQEFGGMNEVFADAYQLFGDEKYLDAALRFSHHWLLDSMAAGVDNLDNHHANTQVPKAVGYQRVAEACRQAGRDADADKLYRAADFFWSTVVNDRSLAIGGNSRREYFPSAADCVSYTEEREGPESCNTNNMLKLTEGLFRMAPSGDYADFYERAVYNHILSTQHPEHGGYVYFTSARPGHYRVYSQPNSAMWCCVGTGMENHGKYSQFVYSHTDDALMVNLFVPSQVRWDDITVDQTTDFPASETSILTVDCPEGAEFALQIRQPFWCSNPTVKVNGADLHCYNPANGYITIDRKWNPGDMVEVTLPMTVRLEEMPNVPDYVAIMRGPILLAAKTSSDDLDGLVAGDSRWGHIATGRLIPISEMPALIGDRDEIVAKLNAMKPVDAAKMQYTVEGLFPEGTDLVLEPFANVHDSRYMMYWLNLSPERWEARQAEIAAREAEAIRIDGLTVDAINFGEQQPEADHRMKESGSESGTYQGQSYRHANGGWFACEMETKGNDNLQLMARYWGNEQGARSFDILIDGEVIAECNNAHLIGKSEFVEVTYPIPARLLKGKDVVTVTFRAQPGNYAGGVYYLRLIKD